MKSRILISVRERQGTRKPLGRLKTLFIGVGLACALVLILGTALLVGTVAALVIGGALILTLGAAIFYTVVRGLWRPSKRAK